MKSLSPNKYRKISINEYVQEARVEFIKFFVSSKVSINNVNVKLDTTQTAFGGSRFWFSCPVCKRRCGVLYEVGIDLLCSDCIK